jgi:AcrR family transcriptional regulator
LQEIAENAEKIKQNMVDAACELFTTVGYNETTVRMITAKAGIDNGHFYYLFSSKDELLDTVVEQLSDEEIAAYEQIASKPIDPLQKLSAMINEMSSERQGRELMIRLVKKRSVVVNNMFIENVMAKVSPLVEKLIIDGVECGVMTTVEPAQTAKLIVNNMIFIFDMNAQTGAEENRQMLDALIHMTETSLGITTGTLGAGIQK